MWIVNADIPRYRSYYPSDYFPREFHCKQEAEKLIKEIKDNIGQDIEVSLEKEE